jgi:hypothetical protein
MGKDEVGVINVRRTVALQAFVEKADNVRIKLSGAEQVV